MLEVTELLRAWNEGSLAARDEVLGLVNFREDLDTLLEIAADASNQEVRRDMAVAYDSLSETRKHLGDSNAAVAYHAEAVRLRRTFGQ